MNSETFAEWFRQQGHHVIRTESSYWVALGPRVYQALPYHWEVQPSKSELKKLFTAHNIAALRYSTSLSSEVGQLSYHVVYRGNSYDIDDLSKKARYDVRKGLDYATYEQISLSKLATDGWEIREDTLIRQNREDAEKRSWWVNLCKSAENLPGFESWGVTHEGKLIAGLLGFTCNDVFYILYQQSLANHMRYGINNALAYSVTRDAISRPSIEQVFYGLQSLDAPESVDKFKFRMNYEAKPVRQRVVFNPWFKYLFNTASHKVFKHLADWTGNSKLSKAEGLIRFYIEGKRPLKEQARPTVLENQKIMEN